MDINERVKKVRTHDAIKLSQREFGKRVGVQDTMISKIENGERDVTKRMVMLICSEFNVNRNWLVNGEGGDDVIFDEPDSTLIGKVASDFGLDATSKKILDVYVNLDEGIRAKANEFLVALSENFIKEKAISAYVEAHDALDSFTGDIDELHDQVVSAFSANFHHIEFPNVHDDEHRTREDIELEARSKQRELDRTINKGLKKDRLSG